MPSEFRRIVFTNAELQEALVDFPALEQVVLPAGKLQSARFNDQTRDTLVIDVYDAKSGQVRDAVLPTHFVAATLVRYCIAKRIPIQRSAQKALTISGDNIALDLRSVSKLVDVPPAETAR